MDFTLSAEHKLLQTSIRRMLDKVATDANVAEWDTSETFPAELYRHIAELGLCGFTFGEQYGGSGPDEIGLCIAVEEIARVSGAMTWAYLSTVSVCARAIVTSGSEEQRKTLLPKIASGEIRFAISLTEPQVGSDLTSLSTKAVKERDDYIVNGQKVFITGADSADYMLTLVRTNPAGRTADALSLLLIPPNAPGVSIRPLHKMAGQSVHTCEVFLDNVRLPASAMVGAPGRGARILFASLDSERICCAAMGLGIAQGAAEKALRYARERQQFGVPILQHQAIGHMLADMVIDVDTARLLTWRAASLLEAGQPCSRAAAIAKIAATEIGTRCASRGMQILGGYSYMIEYGMERYWRESKLYEIAAGTNQILRNLIVKELPETLSPTLDN